MMRRILGASIVMLWLGMVGWQVRREYFQPELARLSAATLSLAPGVSFYTLRMGDRLVGQATSRLDTVQGGFVLEDVMSLELPALGQTGTAVARTSVRLSQALAMETFTFQLDSDVGRFRASGVVRTDTTLVVTIDSGSGEQTVEYKLATPPVFSSIVPIRVAMGGDLEVGNTVRLPVFDPSTMGTRTVELRVLEHDTLIVPDSVRLDTLSMRWSAFHYDSVPSWRVAEIYGGVSVESWVDEDGRVLRASSPLGFSMEKTEFELALQERDDMRLALASGELGAGGLDDDVILSTAVQSNVDLGDATRFSEVRFRLTGVDLTGFELDGGRQTLRGDTLIVRRENWDALDAGYELPYRTMDMNEYLASEPLIQSDDPRIIERARRAVSRAGDDDDPKDVASALTRSVFNSLEKAITISVPSAVQVLESGRGDCNEHTVLFVALARSLGLPARTAVGLVYLNGAFYYHAWPEVWMGDDWVAVDPTFGDWPADAAHIRFITGGLAQQVEIVRLIGRLNIEVLEAVPAPAGEA